MVHHNHHNSPGIKRIQQIALRSKPSDGDDVDGNGQNHNAWSDVVVVLHEGHGPQLKSQIRIPAYPKKYHQKQINIHIAHIS